MFCCCHPSPEEALKAARALLEKANSSNEAQKDYRRAEKALSRIKSSKKKQLVSSPSAADQALCNAIADTYSGIEALLDGLGPQDKANCRKAAESWRRARSRPENDPSSSSTNSVVDSVISPAKASYASPASDPYAYPAKASYASPATASYASPPTASDTSPAAASMGSPASDFSEGTPDAPSLSSCPPSPMQGPLLETGPVRPSFFVNDMYQPPDINKLPGEKERLKNVSQLVYSIDLLRSSQPLDDSLEETERARLAVLKEDEDEREELEMLAIRMIREFDSENLKNARDIAEVVCLVPILEKDDLRRLFVSFFRGIEESKLLDFELLKGLAQLIQLASPDQLVADDLVKTLDLTKTRLQETHNQSSEYIYQLTLTVSHILDAMADNKIKGLDRETLHGQLLTYLRGLNGDSDPHLIHEAAYASQALLYVPDNETLWQATLRRTGKVAKGVAGLVSTVKGLDLVGFVENLGQIQKELVGASEVFQLAKTAYNDVSALVDSGQKLVDCLKDGLSFSQKRAWYPALRGVDILLRNGQLVDFKTLVTKAPCRCDLAFQWGLCRRLGELGANEECDPESRKSAITLLGEMYQNDKDWGYHTSIKQWILDILMQLEPLPGGTTLGAKSLLEKLKTDGDAKKRALYDGCRKAGPGPHQLRKALPSLPLPSLLDRAQNKVNVEPELRRLRNRRLETIKQDFYIPPQAKDNLKVSDDMRFPLMDKLNEFLTSSQKVFLILGDSGAGKSTFNQRLEGDLWGRYQKFKGRIPLYIGLTTIERPATDLITKHLKSEGFTDSQIKELKEYREFILICDGYDESRETNNLYTKNQMNEPGKWCVQMVISCRSEYLGANYKTYFQPVCRNRYKDLDLFREAVIVPFSDSQILKCVEEFVSANGPQWKAADYMEALDRVPGLKDLATNPFLLTLSLTAALDQMDPHKSLSAVRVTRVVLYDDFVKEWLDRSHKRLVVSSNDKDSKIFKKLTDEGFTERGITFLKDLATNIYRHQEGKSEVSYKGSRDKDKWKEEFFGSDRETELMREACPLKRSGEQYQFLHRSLLEYSLALAVFDPEDQGQGTEETTAAVSQPIFESPLGWRDLVKEPSILRFLVERVPQEPFFKKQLLEVIERSKTEAKGSQAAANAITILVRAGVQFNRVDFQGIRIPGADLSHGAFKYANLQRADMTNVILHSVSMHGANLSKAHMEGVQFGELPFLEEESEAVSCAYSPDGETFNVGLKNGDINVYTTSTWEKTKTLSGHEGWVWGMSYSPNGDQIASGSADNTVRLWDVKTGVGRILSDHHDDASRNDGNSFSSVAYSLNGDQIASGNTDSTVSIWEVETGERLHVLVGHFGSVSSVAYSPKDGQIASGSWDCTVRLWDVETGECRQTLEGHDDQVSGVAYSPSGDQIASSSDDMTVRLWDVKTGKQCGILSGHIGSIESVTYSPNGSQIASGSKDKTVRLWDTETRECRHILSGHSNIVLRIMYSPEGDQIAATGWDRTVRLWEVDTGPAHHPFISHGRSIMSIACSPQHDRIASSSFDETMRLWDIESGDCGYTLSGHSKGAWSVVYSPNGDQIASCGEDKTVRLWEAKAGVLRRALIGHRERVSSVAYSPDGHQVASGSDDWEVRLWNTETGVCDHTLIGHSSSVSSVMYSKKGDQIASSSFDKTVRLWNVKTGKVSRILRGHGDCVWRAVYSPNGYQVASGSWDNKVRLWDFQSGACHHTLDGHSNGVSSVVYSPNGSEIASGSFDRTVRLWDAETGVCRHILNGHGSWISCVVYSPNGGQIASGSWDGAVRVWDVASGRCQRVIQIHDKVDSIAWMVTRKGNYLVAGSAIGTIQLWRVYEEDGQCDVDLHWKSPSDALVLTDTTIQDVQGLSPLNMRLLNQRKNIHINSI